MRNQRTYYPSVVLAEETFGHYKVTAFQIAYYDDESISYVVELFHKWTRIEVIVLDTEDKAMRMYEHWKDAVAVQLAKEAFGLAKPMTPDPISQIERTNQP